MSEDRNPRVHPDPDALSAFIEGVLPEHERAECLAHLADCARCRELVFLARNASDIEEPAPGAAAAPVSFWRRFLRPAAIMSVVAVAIALLSFGIYRMGRRPERQPELTASTKAPAGTAPVLPVEPQTHNSQPAPKKAIPPPVDRLQEPRPVPETLDTFQINGTTTVTETAGVTGTISDPAGSIIVSARVELKNEDTGAVYTSASDARGEYQIAGLAPGRYDLGVTVPGFKKFTQNGIALQPQQIARLDSALQVGAATESVTVTAEAALLKTESADSSHKVDLNSLNNLPLLPGSSAVYTLPDKSTPASTATKNSLVVAVDITGTVFVSENAGASWTPVIAAWKGKAVRVSVNANGAFELTTNPLSTWVSTDGHNWSGAPASR